MSSQTDARGKTIQFSYDVLGRALTQPQTARKLRYNLRMTNPVFLFREAV
nr:hypothetical protein [Leptospira santarosai]